MAPYGYWILPCKYCIPLDHPRVLEILEHHPRVLEILEHHPRVIEILEHHPRVLEILEHHPKLSVSVWALVDLVIS